MLKPLRSAFASSFVWAVVHDDDVHPADRVDLVVVDLREDDLLFEADARSCRGRRSSCPTGRGSRARAAARS